MIRKSHPTINDYASAAAYLGNKWDRPLHGRSTRLQRVNGTEIAVRYHATNIVIYHVDGSIMIRTGGYQTVTTKRKINEYSPVRLYQSKFVWYLPTGDRFYDSFTYRPGDSLQPRKVHYIAMAGLYGCSPLTCEVFETKRGAIDSLLSQHDLGDRSKYARELRATDYTDLRLGIHGNEYCEIAECDCNNPSQHSDSGDDLGWLNGD